VGWTLLAQYTQRIFVSILLDMTVGGEVASGSCPLENIGSRNEGECSLVVASVEVDASECECILAGAWPPSACIADAR